MNSNDLQEQLQNLRLQLAQLKSLAQQVTSPHQRETMATACQEAEDTLGRLQIAAQSTQVDSVELLHTVVKNAPIALFALDSSGVFTFTDGKGLELVGKKPGESVGRSIFELYRDYPDILENIRSCLNGREFEWISQVNDITFNNCAALLRDRDGQITGLIGVATDITKQKQAEEQITRLNTDLERQVQERTIQLQQAINFEAVLKRITDKVRDSLDEAQILQTAVRELGLGLKVKCCGAAIYDAEHTVSTIRYEYTTSIPSALGQVGRMAEKPEIYYELLQGQHVQFCTILPDPIRQAIDKQFAILAFPLMDDEGVLGDVWLFKSRDATFDEIEIRLVQQVANQCVIAMRQARLYQAVQAQVESLEKLNQLKDDFLSTVSHELRTPVSNMKIAISMLLITLERQNVLSGPNSKVARYLQILQSECDREISLINDLLDLQRIEAGVQSLDLESIHIQTWLPQIVKPFKERARTQQLSLQLKCEQALPLLHTDNSGLERILVELLNNACKYTPAGERITITVAATPDRMQFRVSNSGVEIAASELDRIFDKFYRIKSTDYWQQGGTGLGLALVKRLTEHLGGTLQVESSCNQTTFTVDLPVELSLSSLLSSSRESRT